VVLANYGLWRAARSKAGFNAYFHLDKTRSRELHSSDVLALRSRAQVRRRMSNARASYPNPKTTIAVTKAVEYLRAKQSYNGGFCFYKYAYLDQPNLRDTYRWLQSTHQIVQLQCRLAGPTDTPRILDAIADLEHGGGYGEKANLPDTALSLRILELLQETPSSSRESRVFVDGLQRPALGFTNTADSLSANLDVLTAGIECCALLRLPVRYQEDIFAFLFACQAADGSFSQVPLALPDIATTHQALKIIYALHFPKQSNLE
jgi:Prenyltransferase and squalene oxidase repeat